MQISHVQSLVVEKFKIKKKKLRGFVPIEVDVDKKENYSMKTIEIDL